MTTGLFGDLNVKMPNDTTIVSVQSGRLTQAYTYYLGYIEKIYRAVFKATVVAPSSQTWETVAGADLAGALVAATVNALVNEIKADVNTNSAASAAVEAKLNTVIAALKTAGLMES